MNQQLNHLAVNWSDGMKLNKDHFIQMEHSVIERVNDSTGIAIKDYEFGLLASQDKSRLSLDISVFDGKIILNTCRAITINGTRIEIDNLDLPELQESIEKITTDIIKEEGKLYLIILNVNPFKTIPIGIPNNEESPPRQPSLIPSYSINVVPYHQLKTIEFTAFNLPVGKMIYQSGEFKMDNHYIPPCNRVDAHTGLFNRFEELKRLISELEANTIKVFQRSRDEQKKGKINYLANSVNSFSEYILDFLTLTSSHFHFFYKQESGKLLINYFVRLAKVIHLSWIKLRDSDREEMLNYFEKHSGYSPNELRKIINNTIQITYNHIDIDPDLTKVEQFLSIFNRLFSILIELKFISQTVEGIIRTENKIGEKRQIVSPKKGGGMFKK